MDESEDEWEEQTVAIELIGMIDPDKLSMIDEQNTAVLVSMYILENMLTLVIISTNWLTLECYLLL